jgi:Protein of unknown function (DUF3095)
LSVHPAAVVSSIAPDYALPLVSAGDSGQFFHSLPELTSFSEVVEPERYVDVPDDWLVIITDVRGSTVAIEQGRYRDVNAVGAASIIAMRNALPHLEVPYVFGGDGATLLIPATEREVSDIALRGLSKMSREAFNLELRCGVVPVGQLRAEGHAVLCARFRVSEHTSLAMFMGDGFAAAERRIKQDTGDGGTRVPSEGAAEVDLSGFECRWQPIKSERGVMLSLLVLAREKAQADKTATYREVLRVLEGILGNNSGHPVTLRRLQLKGPFGDYSVEARARSAAAQGERFDLAYAHARKKASIGKALRLMGASAGGFDSRKYPLELIQNCDFRKFDDVLRMVLDVSPKQAAAIDEVLEQLRGHGTLVYGTHRSTSALMTCFVRSFSGDHVHFIDGSDGGYALAAKQLKAQLAALA